MKKIYLIRHGESEGNIGQIRQSDDMPLTERGKKQAEFLSERISNLDFDLLISSPVMRAKQTAEIISKTVGKEILFEPLFRERIRVSYQYNKPKNDPESERIELEYYEAFKKGEKYMDGESFLEITERAKKSLDFLRNLKEENVVVVTHGMFMRVIAAVVVLGDVLTPETCDRFMNILRTRNTGISLIEIDEEDKWRLSIWNDQSHFA